MLCAHAALNPLQRSLFNIHLPILEILSAVELHECLRDFMFI